jgi:hypothetical protein
MRLLALLVLLSILSGKAFAQEALINDLKQCDRFYLIRKDIIKQLEEENDTLTYYYDPELIIFFNRNDKNLSPNSFYIFNHGLNKLISLRITEIDVEATDEKGKKAFFANDESRSLQMLYKDSFPDCSYGIAGFKVTVAGYTKVDIQAMHVEISYYDTVYDKWFLNKKDYETDKPSIPAQLINFLFERHQPE